MTTYRWRISILAATALALGCAAATAAAATAATSSITFQATNEGSEDQFVVTFPGTAPSLSSHASTDGPVWGGSGKPVTTTGNYFVYLTGGGTNYPLAGSNPATYSLTNLQSAVLYDDSEGEIGIALGLSYAASYTVSTNGDQVTVDVDH